MKNFKILQKVFEPTSFDCQTEKQDLQIAITLNPDLYKILEAMEMAQKEAYNQAINDAAESATIRFIPFSDNQEVNKESILKLLK